MGNMFEIANLLIYIAKWSERNGVIADGLSTIQGLKRFLQHGKLNYLQEDRCAKLDLFHPWIHIPEFY